MSAFGKIKSKPTKASYFTTLQTVAKEKNLKFDTGNHPGKKIDAIMNKFFNTKEELTPEEKDIMALAIEKDAIDAGEDESKEKTPCNESLRDKVIDYFVQNGRKKQELAAELQERFEDIGDRMSDAELDKLKALLATNDGIVSPQIIEVLYKSIKEKKITPGLYERMSLNFYYYGSKVVGGAMGSYGKLQEKVIAPCVGTVMDLGSVATKTAGTLTAAVFVRDAIIPLFWEHIFPTVSEIVFKSTTNSTAGGRKKRTRKYSKKTRTTKKKQRRH
jgi:hypothetical protein